MNPDCNTRAAVLAAVVVPVVVVVGVGCGLNAVLELKLPPLPRPEGAPPRNSQSMPNVRSSVSVTSAIVSWIRTWRCGTSSFFSAASITAYSAGVATIRMVLLSLSATTWTLRTTPMLPSAPTGLLARARATACATGPPVVAGGCVPCCWTIVVCGCAGTGTLEEGWA